MHCRGGTPWPPHAGANVDLLIVEERGAHGGTPLHFQLPISDLDVLAQFTLAADPVRSVPPGGSRWTWNADAIPVAVQEELIESAIDRTEDHRYRRGTLQDRDQHLIGNRQSSITNH